jgi:hypothetical protein
LSGEPLARVTRAFTYCQDLAVDVDGGIYLGGAGFVHEARPLDVNPSGSRAALHTR